VGFPLKIKILVKPLKFKGFALFIQAWTALSR
jgi:hypothetical protein